MMRYELPISGISIDEQMNEAKRAHAHTRAHV